MDVNIEFYPITIDRKIVDGTTKVYIYGRDRSKKQFCLIDTYQPYFYVLPHDEIHNIAKSISSMELDGIKVQQVEIVKVKFGIKEKEVIKIITKTQKEIQIIKKQIELLDIGTAFDHDIGTLRKYIFDRKINFLVSHNVIGELEENHPDMKCAVIKLKSIEEIGTDIYKPDIMAINIETYSPFGKQKIPTKDPIVMISFISRTYRKVITWKHFKTDNPEIEIVSSEEELITRARDILDAQKPDVLVGYNSDNFDLPYIKFRAAKYKINFDIGLDYSPITTLKETSHIAGICHVDLFKLSKFVFHVKASNLDALIYEMVPDNNKVKTFSDLVSMWNKGDIENLCEHYLIDSEYILKITFKYMGYLIALTKFMGLPLFEISRMNAQHVVEWYLIKNAKDQNVIVPVRPNDETKKERLSQGQKHEPFINTKSGLYSHVISFNFESLYPAIIAAHNISSESANCGCCTISQVIEINNEPTWFCQNNKGFIPLVLDDVLSRIFRIIDILKNIEDGKKRKILNTRLEISRMIANLFYLNFSHSASRWYNRKLYDATLHFCYNYINLICEIIKEKGFDIIFCDAKKMYVCMNDKTQEDVKQLVEFINLSLPGIMELKTENYFERALFLDYKNRVMLTDTNEIKIIGFEYVQKDFCFYAQRMQIFVLKQIMQNNSISEALRYVQQMIFELRHHKVPVDDLIIYRVLSKNIEEYSEELPHVEVAKEMRAKNYVVGPGSVIKYVIIQGIGQVYQRAKIPLEVKKENIDSRYYIENQIMPAIEKIFALFNITRDELLLSKTQVDLESFK